jgi:hypothetical protein
MSEVKVINLPYICRNFPKNPTSEVSRENLLDTIDRTFKSDTVLLVIEGNEGIGKTTLLAQYAKRQADFALSLFITPISRVSYSPEYLRLVLCEQINWALYKTRLDPDAVNDLFLSTQLTTLQKRALRNKEVFYFIIDGLHDLPEEDFRIQNIILQEILPMGLEGFRFLLSGELKKLPYNIQKTVSCKPFPLPYFSLDETRRYLKDLELDRQILDDIHQMCQGVPEHLASVRRLIQSGVEINNIFDEDPDKLPDFLGIEWRKIREASHVEKSVLALIAFGRKSYSTEDISRILNLDLLQVEESLQGFSILTTDSESKCIEFVSESMRKFASKELRNYKEEVTNFLIDDLLKDAESERALTFLPDYFEQAGRLDELLDYLTPEHFSKILERSQSLYPVRQRAEMGLMSSQKLNQEKALIRFSMQKSVITELEKAEIWRSEIEARMALKDYDSALALAHSIVLKEDKLHLLTTIAKIKCEEGLTPEPELLKEIELLYNQVDQKYFGKRATEIAANLIWFNPDLAIELIDTSINIEEDKKEHDWAFAKLSILAIAANYNQSLPSDIAEQTQSRIRDPMLHKFTQAASMFFGDFSASEVIAHAEKVELQNRLFFIRHWAIVNQDKEKAADVIDYALDLLIKNTPYTPKTRDLREIAAPLPYVFDKTQAKALVGRFDSLKGTIENLGTTVDYVRLQLLLALTESKYDFDAASNRVLEVYWYVGNINELTTKAECLAWMISTFNKIDTKGILESNEGILAVTEKELKSNVEELLNTTADHYNVTKGIIKALSISKPNIAIEIAQSLNVAMRRDLATLVFIETLIEAPFKKNDLSLILVAIKKIKDIDLKDEALSKVIERLSEVAESVDPEVVDQALPIIDSINEISSAYLRCLACCFAYNFLKAQNADKYESFLLSLLMRLDHAWEVLDVGWLKVNAGFRVTKSIANTSTEIASKYLNLTTQVKYEIIIDAEKPALTYIACLKLAIRAFGGLLPSNINTDEDMERLTRLIDFIPSNVEKAGLWGDIALLCFINNLSDKGKTIVSNHLKPIIIDIRDDNDKYQVITKTAPALYFAHPQTTIEMIQQMLKCKHDEAFSEICDFILRKSLPSDPYENLRGSGYTLTYEEAVDICGLLNLMNTDGDIYKYIEDISNSIFLKYNRERFTEQQKADIVNRIDEIISKKLPDLQNIRHDGYKIAALAQVARIRRASSSVWNDLIESARKIPNIADVAYVLCIIGMVLPSRLSSKRDEIFEEAINLVEKINSDLDRTERFEDIADILVNINEGASRKCLRLGIETSLRLNDPDLIYPTQRRIIDLAHKIKPSFAESLADLVDTDPARRSAKYKDLKRHLEILNLKNKMSEQTALELDTKTPISMYPKAAWMNLGALNGGRITTIHSKYLMPYISAAAELPLSESYPILAWAIENNVKRLAKTSQARTNLIPIFEATLLGAELASRITMRTSAQLKQIKTQTIESSVINQNVVIRAGERDKAIQFIKDWLTQEVKDYLKICDPYYGVEELEILQILVSLNPKCAVKILTSKKHQQQEQLSQPWDEAFRTHWRRISDQNPPETEIIIVGLESSGELPIHDRWWFTQHGGLRLGTSFNSLGINKTSEISILSTEESKSRENEVDQYISRQVRIYNNEKLTFNLFSL